MTNFIHLCGISQSSKVPPGIDYYRILCLYIVTSLFTTVTRVTLSPVACTLHESVALSSRHYSLRSLVSSSRGDRHSLDIVCTMRELVARRFGRGRRGGLQQRPSALIAVRARGAPISCLPSATLHIFAFIKIGLRRSYCQVLIGTFSLHSNGLK